MSEQMSLGLPPQLRVRVDDGIVVDCFAGGGGTSLGIRWATGRDPDIAINHDPEAIAMHKANHRNTQHLCGDIFDVDPRGACKGRHVALLWLSPDCTFHSVARGGKPFRDPKKAEGRRGLAWVVGRWAREVQPDVIMLENVLEFADWGPLDEETGRPDKSRRGLTFRRWWGELEAAGYRVEMRRLRACDYGAPTTRKRLFIIARRDGKQIVWPEPTHGPGTSQPYRTAAECIDWSIPTVSIFATREEGRAHGVNRPLVEKTMARIGRGIWKYVIGAAEAFVVPVKSWGGGGNDPRSLDQPLRTVTTSKRGEYALVAPSLVQTGYGERPGQTPRALDIHTPLGTSVAGGVKHALVAAFLAKHYGGPRESTGLPLAGPMATVTTQDHHALVAAHMLKLKGTCLDGQPMTAPAPTICAGGTHLAEVRAFLVKYYQGGSPGASLREPMPTSTTHDRFGLVTVAGVDYQIVDIAMRMLAARELFRANSFPDDYKIDPVVDGKPLTKTAQIRMCGNCVPPVMSEALVKANVGRLEMVAA